MIISEKDDNEGLERLKKMSKSEILMNKKELLEWLQDMNWPVAKGMAEILSNYTNDLDIDIQKIILGKDLDWKYWVTIRLLYYSKVRPSNFLLGLLQNKIENPTQIEIEYEFIQECQDVLDKWGYKSDKLKVAKT